MTGPDPAARAGRESPQWPSWLPADGSSGVPHLKPGTGGECPYLAIVACNKCGWADPDPERVKAAMDLLDVARGVFPPRSWVIELPAGEPILTANHRMNKYAANRRTQDLKGLMIDLCRVHKVPRLAAATVTVEYRCPPRRKADRHPLAADRVEDHDALYPTRKALVDGLVKADVLVDDRAAYVKNSACRILPETHSMGLLRVTITEVPGGEQR